MVYLLCFKNSNQYLSMELGLNFSCLSIVGFAGNNGGVESLISIIHRSNKNIDLKISSEEDHPELSCWIYTSFVSVLKDLIQDNVLEWTSAKAVIYLVPVSQCSSAG